MPRKSPQITIEEISSELYPGVAEAQANALPFMSLHLVETIHDLLATGTLVKINNKIIPNPKRSS
jgi:hypothetical protein